MKNQRPKNLNLFTIRFPLPAIVSILHRLSGVFLFLLIPFALWALNLSLSTPEGYETIHTYLSSGWAKLIVWCCLSAFLYHFVAGIRHLLMDIGIAEELKSGRVSAVVAITVSVLLIILAGIFLW